MNKNQIRKGLSGLNASVSTAPADTLDKYIINGEKVEKFDGSLLAGTEFSPCVPSPHGSCSGTGE